MSPERPKAKIEDDLIETAQGDAKLADLLRQAADEFERRGSVGPVKERLIRKRMAKMKRRARNASHW